MKAKKTAPPRRRISFAVDREEIEINSDWVEAVMASPTPPVVPFPAPPLPAVPATPVATVPERDFFAPVENHATGEVAATGEKCSTAENRAPEEGFHTGANSDTGARTAAGEQTATGEVRTTGAVLITGTKFTTGAHIATDAKSVELFATVANEEPVAEVAAVERWPKKQRTSRPRPILRITDGLTTGQYAVYSLMYEAGQGAEANSRIYSGGYADLGRLTGLSKRGIQNIVGELQAKQVIRLHRQPGYHRTETSAYVVPEPAAVLQVWYSSGWRHALGKSKTLRP
jgi:hypothetical protein